MQNIITIAFHVMLFLDDLCVCNSITQMELNPISAPTLEHPILN